MNGTSAKFLPSQVSGQSRAANLGHQAVIGLKTRSNISTVDRSNPEPIRVWQQRYERHLFLTGRKTTQERYARALEKFLGKHKDRIYPHEFLRPRINDYVQTRFEEGASIATVRLELSAIRSFW